jgi:sulfite reductase (NADPH) flavoprotein alpha-component
MISPYILFGTQTGNAGRVASAIHEELNRWGLNSELWDMAEISPEEIISMKQLIIVTSTFGDGEAPDNASEWLSYLKFYEGLKLEHLEFAVLGLGDTYYPHFCQCGKDFDHWLEKHGAKRLLQRLDCDLYFEEQYPDWLEQLIKKMKSV